MKKIQFIIFVLILGCKGPELDHDDFPIFGMESVVIDEDIIKLKAEIIEDYPGSIIAYGFVWGRSQNLNIDQFTHQEVSGRPEGDGFEIETRRLLSFTIDPITVKPYIRTDRGIFYGYSSTITLVRSTTPLDTNVILINPSSGSAGDRIVIVGDYLTGVDETTVTFETSRGTKSAEVVSRTTTTLTFVVPDFSIEFGGAGEEFVTIYVELDGARTDFSWRFLLII